MMATIRITDLRLRTIIGTNDWERKEKQDIVINIVFAYDAQKAVAHDVIQKAIDYKTITKKIIKKVESSRFYLLESLTQMILHIVLAHPRVQRASVRVDKPYALRFADSVSVELTKE